jgi:hypothetical protein
MKLSSLTLGVGFFIVVSATFARQVFDFLCGVFGNRQVGIGLAGLFFLLALCLFVYINKTLVSRTRKFVFLVVLGLGFCLAWQQRLFPERIHLLEYGALGWLAMKDLSRNGLNIKKFAFAVLVVLVFSCLDETLQRFLPYRVGDLKDIFLNLAGGALGLSLFLLKSSPKNNLDSQA